MWAVLGEQAGRDSPCQTSCRPTQAPAAPRQALARVFSAGTPRPATGLAWGILDRAGTGRPALSPDPALESNARAAGRLQVSLWAGWPELWAGWPELWAGRDLHQASAAAARQAIGRRPSIKLQPWHRPL